VQVYVLLRRFPIKVYRALRAQLGRGGNPSVRTLGGAATQRELGRCCDVLIMSSFEVREHFVFARERGVVPETICREWVADAAEGRRVLYGLRKKVLADLA
jgi:hypothetical protein